MIQEKKISDVYSLITTSDNVLLQNTSSIVIELYVTDGTAPLLEAGIRLNPGQAINRNEIPTTGDLYARCKRGSNGSLIVAE